jgi:hypothetical protein
VDPEFEARVATHLKSLINRSYEKTWKAYRQTQYRPST